MNQRFFEIEQVDGARLLRLVSADGTNRLTCACILELTRAIERLRDDPLPLVIAGNPRFFSVGADLNEIASLNAADALQFSLMGQKLMNEIASFPAPVIAAIEGHCMGGGFDLALACHRRVAGPRAVFGHRGAALGLITGWGGTQRLPRLIGKGRALELLVAAEKISARHALEIGIAESVSDDPLAEAMRHV